MKDKLTSPNVLALNANWQAIDVYTPQKAFCMMASGAAAGIDTSGGSTIHFSQRSGSCSHPKKAKLPP
jgi:hypothetical protein